MPLLAFCCYSPFPLLATQDNDIETEALLSLSLEQLLDTPVHIMGKKPQQLSDIPAAVFIITQDDIQQAGVRTIPDLLRMVPGMHVTQINSHAWGVSARGFNQLFANKMLVMIDGRSIYAREFSGVWWDQVNLVVADIERIEVIRGPGSTAWGANAVNGVVNIITKSAEDTQGTAMSLAAGDQLQYLFNLRHTEQVGDKSYLRLYAQRRAEQSQNVALDDSYQNTQVGFRLDSQYSSQDKWTLQGDYYRGYSGNIDFTRYNPPVEDETFQGGNLLARWQHDFSEHNNLQIQAYIEQYQRDVNYVAHDTRILDLDVQQHFRPAKRHDLVWGFDWRHYQQDADNNTFNFNPADFSESLFSFFAQDEITLTEKRWYLTLGTKFEHLQGYGWESLPNIRLLWTPNEKRSLWAAVSRAIRQPDWSRARGQWPVNYVQEKTHLPLPMTINILPSPNLEPERLLAYELGWREQLSRDVFADANMYYHEYDKVVGTIIFNRDINPQGVFTANAVHENLEKRHRFGAALSLNWQVKPNWKLQGAYTYINDQNPYKENPDQPKHQASLRSHWQINPKWSLNTWLRYYHHLDEGDLNFAYIKVAAHTDLDLRLNWQLSPGLNLSLTGINLLKPSHEQSRWDIVGQLYLPSQRQAYLQLDWQF